MLDRPTTITQETDVGILAFQNLIDSAATDHAMHDTPPAVPVEVPGPRAASPQDPPPAPGEPEPPAPGPAPVSSESMTPDIVHNENPRIPDIVLFSARDSVPAPSEPEPPVPAPSEPVLINDPVLPPQSRFLQFSAGARW